MGWQFSSFHVPQWIYDPDPFAKIFMFKWIFTFFDTIINQLLEFKENMCQSVLRAASFSSLFLDLAIKLISRFSNQASNQASLNDCNPILSNSSLRFFCIYLVFVTYRIIFLAASGNIRTSHLKWMLWLWMKQQWSFWWKACMVDRWNWLINIRWNT